MIKILTKSIGKYNLSKKLTGDRLTVKKQDNPAYIVQDMMFY